MTPAVQTPSAASDDLLVLACVAVHQFLPSAMRAFHLGDDSFQAALSQLEAAGYVERADCSEHVYLTPAGSRRLMDG
jgi:competence protein ComGC